MTNLTALSNLGETNGGGTTLDLFLKKFSNEVLLAYARATLMKPNVTVRYANNGKSAQFPALGTATATIHQAGQSLYTTGSYLNNIMHAEVEIFCDRPLVAPVAIDQWEEMINHYDVRGPYRAELAEAIARIVDERLLTVGILGARQEAATVTGQPRGSSQLLAAGGNKLTPNAPITPNAGFAGSNPSGSLIVDALFAVKALMNTNNVPVAGRCVALDPLQVNAIVRDKQLIDRDFNGAFDNGSLVEGTVKRVCGFKVIESNSVAAVRLGVSTPTGANNSYTLTGTKHAFLCWHPSAIGMVTWRDLVMEADLNNVEYQTNFFNAKLSAGFKWIRPEGLVEVTTP